MQFQGMDSPLSPDQEVAFIQERSSTVFPATPTASKWTMPASTYAALPPIDTQHAADGDKDVLESSIRDDQRHLQYAPVKTIGEVTTTEMVTSPQVRGGEKVALKSEEMLGSKDLKPRFVTLQDDVVESRKDEDTLARGKKGDLSPEKQKMGVNERTLTLEM